MEEKIYILKIGESTYFSESKEEIVKLWEILADSNLKRLLVKSSWVGDESEYFYYPAEGGIRVELEVKKLYLHENEERARKAKIAHERAVKVGIIAKKKKKKKT